MSCQSTDSMQWDLATNTTHGLLQNIILIEGLFAVPLIRYVQQLSYLRIYDNNLIQRDFKFIKLNFPSVA